MKSFTTKLAVTFPFMLCAAGLAEAESLCKTENLRGQYVFTATGFTRAPNSLPGAPWVPKAILEVLQFNGDGTLTAPTLAVANPFGDTGAILQPPQGGASGTYSINADCSGTVQFLDPAQVAFKIHIDGPFGFTIWMIQTNPANNVFGGTAERVR